MSASFSDCEVIILYQLVEALINSDLLLIIGFVEYIFFPVICIKYIVIYLGWIGWVASVI